MRKHNGMRPQDIAILLKIVALDKASWQLVPLAKSLNISMSEISESLNRSRKAGLIDYSKKRPNRESIMEFLEYGVKYVFPQEPGAISKGIPTAHSHPFMKKHFSSSENYIWPDPKGKTLGQAIEPLYEKQPAAALEDERFYKLLALVDVLRVGRVREVKVAIQELRKNIIDR
jgi:predicted transcriptional regulator